MELSVIIVNYNVEHFLEQCLLSVRAASKGIDIEVFVVDNISIDGSVKMVKEKFPEVHLIENKENVGFSRANNQAIRISKGKYVLLLNPDTVVEEDTFLKTIQFMDENEDCGGLGVKMIDGKGNFLPESKRGLPTPAVAFYKIFGLSTLFPRSKKFGRYHLGYLSKEETHSIEILSGAYMMMRKETLDKVGLLDEEFFMYGEDIDLSYRIILGGYKNYYFHDTSIIHYKGESTKKSSVNYVFVFYNAMIIFAKKHFSEKNAKTFSFLINLAIYLRAAMALFSRFVKKMAFPFFDWTLSLSALWGITELYQRIKPIEFEDDLIFWSLPLYALNWVFFTWISGGYDKPIKLLNVLKGGLLGGGILLAIYGLLPKDLQFSRFIVLFGMISTILIMILTRIMLHFLKFSGYRMDDSGNKIFAIVSDQDESERIMAFLRQTVSVKESFLIHPSVTDELPEPYFGHRNQLQDIVHIHNVDEVIFSAKNLSAKEIIAQMSSIRSAKNVDYKIAQPDSTYLIGSNSIHTAGDLYLLDLDSISSSQNRRNKRLFDILFSFMLLPVFPLIMWVMIHPFKFVSNLFTVLFGKKSWVGYVQNGTNIDAKLPKIKTGVICPTNVPNMKPEFASKINLLYAKDYSVNKDMKAVFQQFRKL